MKFLVSTSAALLLSLAGASSYAASIVTNGSFEDNLIGGVYAPNFEYKTVLTGWQISSPGSQGVPLFNKANYSNFSNGNYLGSDGAQAIQLELGGHSISQALTGLVLNQQYVLSFDYGSYVAPPSAALSYSLDGVTTSLTGLHPGWQTYTVGFTFTGNNNVLSFTSNSPLSPNSYPHLDNVSVTAVPEATTSAMLLAGLGVMGLLVQRRRQTGSPA